MMVERNTRTFVFFLSSALFLGAFGLYLWCFQPGGAWGDGGDFVLCSHFLGVPHPTGYPTFALLGKLATYVPAGSLGMRVGLLSSFAGALGVALFFMATAWLAGLKGAAFYAAAVLAVTSFFWSTSSVIEVYALNICFCWAIILAFQRRDDLRYALAFFVIGALGMGNHGTLVVPAVILGAILLFGICRRMGVIAGVATVFFLTILWISAYLCLPLFSARSLVFDWNNVEFARNMPMLLSGYDFWVIGEYIPAEMWKNFLQLALSINSQVTISAAILFVIAICSPRGSIKDRWAMLAIFIVAGLFPILYPTKEKEAFFLISYTLLIAMAAGGIGALFYWGETGTAGKISLAALVLAGLAHGAMLLGSNSANFDIRRDDSPRIFSDALFLSAHRDALVLVDHLADDTIFPPLEEQFTRNRRRDAFLFHRLYLAFPWYMDSMRARAAQTGATVNIPYIDLADERERNIEVGIEEKQRANVGKTMNTIAIDVQTVRLIEANSGGVPIYINTPDRFKRSRISKGLEFAPDGALFRLGAAEGVPPPAMLAAALDLPSPVFRKCVREILMQRGVFHDHQAATFYKIDEGKYYGGLMKVAADLNTALQYGDDCETHGVLGSVYARLGMDNEARAQLSVAAECQIKKYDIR